MRTIPKWTGRTGKLKQATFIQGICWEFPAGTICKEATGIDNVGPCWLLDETNVTGPAAKHDLIYRFPTVGIDAVEVDG